MDVKAEIEKVMSKVTKDSSFKEKFEKDPLGTVKGVVGDKVDKETLNKIVETVKGMLKTENLSEIGGKISGALGNLLGKKE